MNPSPLQVPLDASMGVAASKWYIWLVEHKRAFWEPVKWIFDGFKLYPYLKKI